MNIIKYILDNRQPLSFYIFKRGKWKYLQV